MASQMSINLPREKTRQHLLKYFETRKDIKIKSLEPDSVQVRKSGWNTPPPLMNIKIGMFEEDNKTRLGFDFDFYAASLVVAVAVVIGLAILWVVPLTRIGLENLGAVALLPVGFTIVVLLTTPISFANGTDQAKRKFLDDIRKEFIFVIEG